MNNATAPSVVTPIQTVDAAYAALRAKQITRDAAVLIVMSAIKVTQLGAEELLDHPVTPSVRYGQIGGDR